MAEVQFSNSEFLGTVKCAKLGSFCFRFEGAFLIPYLVVLFLVGRPMYYFELLLGQFSTLGCIQCWEIVPAFKGKVYTFEM